MTTPNQPKPDYGLVWEDLSYEIGGGIYNYGQFMTEEIATMLIHGPKAAADNAWALMEDKFLQMPLEVLRQFSGFIEGTTIEDDFQNVRQSVDTIIGWIPTIPIMQSVKDFAEWVANTFEPLGDLVQGIIDAIIQGFHGWAESISGFGLEDLKRLGVDIGAGLGELNTIIMRVTKLEGAITHAIENFATYVKDAIGELSLGDKWDQIYSGIGSGTLGIKNGYATFTSGLDTVNRTAVAISKEVLGSDFQTVSATLSKPLTDLAQSANTILARVDPTKVNGDRVFAHLTDTTATIGYVKNGVTTILGSVGNILKNGSTYTLEAGVGGAANTFRLVEGSKQLLKVTDPAAGTASGSSIGAAFRNAGFGAFAPNPTARPGLLAAFASFSR